MTTAIPSWFSTVTRAHVRSRRYRAWLCILTAAAMLMAWIPLLNVVGFGFAFVLLLRWDAALLARFPDGFHGFVA